MKKIFCILLMAFAAHAADKKISDLTLLPGASWATNDVLPIVDISVPETKKTSIADFDLRYFQNASTLQAIHGGTGQSTYTAGDLLYALNGTSLSKLPIGSSTQILSVASGFPSWINPPVTGANRALSNLLSTSINAGLFVDTDNAYNIGSSTFTFANIYTHLLKGNSIGTLSGSGSVNFTNAVNMSTFKIANLGDPTLAQDAATRAYVDNNGGLRNYTPLGNAEGANPFVMYADGTAVPVNGTGGSPLATVAFTSSSPLAGTQSFLFTPGNLGDGAAYDFTLDRGDKASSHSLNMALEVVSGTYTKGDLTVWLYDKTAGKLFAAEPNGYVENHPQPGKQKFNFQMPTNTDLRLLIHQATNASTYTVKFEEAINPALTPGFGLTAFTSTDNTVPAAGGTLTVPHNLGVSPLSAVVILKNVTPESNWTTGDEVEIGSVGVNNDTNIDGNLMIYSDTTNVNVVMGSGALTIYNKSTGASYAVTRANWKIVVKAFANTSPIVSEYDGRVISAQITSNAALTSPTGTPTIFPDVVYDLQGAYNVSTGEYTCQVSGVYTVSLSGVAPSAAWNGTLYKNGVYYLSIMQPNATIIGSGTIDAQCSAGDTLTIVQTGTSAFLSYSAGNYQPTLSISLKSGAQQILTGQKIEVEAYLSADQALTSSVIVFDTETIDTTASYNNATGKFTAPVTGKYLVTVSGGRTSGTGNLYTRVNGSLATQSRYLGQFSSTSPIINGVTTLSLVQGDYLEILGSAGTIAGGNDGTAYHTFLTIKQVN